MSGRRRHDPLALLAPLAGTLTLALATHPHAVVSDLTRLAAHARIAGPTTIVAATALAVVAAAVRLMRRRHLNPLLASRQTWVLVPADAHDPSLEEVARFAAQLTRVRRRGRARLERPAAAIRIRIHSAPDGRLAYELHAPGHARGVLPAALGAYPDVELHDPRGSGSRRRPDGGRR